MNLQEFSDSFDTLVNSYSVKYNLTSASTQDLVFDEYEKSVFLTEAEREIVINLYNGKNAYGDFFESSEELRRYLDGLISTKVYTEEDKLTENLSPLSDKSVFFELPGEIAFITLEQVTFSDSALCEGSEIIADVYPVKHDEYGRVKDNPFRGPTRYKALRIDTGSNIVELVSKYNISKYLVKYMRNPEPIILIDLPDGLTIDGKFEATECKVNPILHNTILNRAVLLALASKNNKLKSE